MKRASHVVLIFSSDHAGKVRRELVVDAVHRSLTAEQYHRLAELKAKNSAEILG